MAMLLLLLLLIENGNAQIACIWGKSGTNNIINGEYEYQGEFNGAPWFQKEQRRDNYPYLYLWRDNDTYHNQYIITALQPQNTTPSRFGYCSISTTVPWECGVNQWMIYDDESEFDLESQVYSQQHSCPEWNCDAITTSIDYGGCNDIFDVQIDRNVWSNDAGTRYWWFSDDRFRWICTSDEEYYETDSSISLYAYSEEGWIDAAKGWTIKLKFEYPDNNTYSMQCLETVPTTEPTTNEPTSNEPTMEPTLEPTIEPTINGSCVCENAANSLIGSNFSFKTISPTIWYLVAYGSIFCFGL